MTRPRRSRVNNFNPRGWWILYINAGLGRINLSSARLKVSMKEEFWMFGSIGCLGQVEFLLLLLSVNMCCYC